MERVYNKPSLVEFEGVLQKNRNKRPTCDQKFLEWCKENSIRFGSYEDMGKKLGMDGSCFKRLMDDYNMELVFDPKARMTPKLYKDKDWLFHEVIELNKKADQIAKENGWTPRVVKKWMGLLGINNDSYQKLKKLSDKQKELISFSLLGDGCIASNNIFIVSHSIKQKDYLFWKYSILKDLCNKEPTFYEAKEKVIRGKETTTAPAYRFGTKKITELEEIRNKSVMEIINSLNNFGLSIWLLDDGYRGPSWELCVASYTEKEKQFILKKFNEFGLFSAHLAPSDPRYLTFNASDSRTIDQIILKEIPNDLDIIKYKILENDKIRPEKGLQKIMARKVFLDYVWEKCISPQIGYSFSIPHDVAYSIEAVQEANLATRFNPLFWECACLSINAGNTFTNFEAGEDADGELEEPSDASLASPVKTGAPNYAKISKAISDSQLRGVNIELPDINTAQADFIPDIKNNGILYSLKNVAAVSDDLFSRIISARPYSSIEDFYDRVQPTEAEMVGLIKAGCFCGIDKRAVRAQLVWFLNKRANDSFPVRDKITSVQLKKMMAAKASLPGYENELRVCNFYAYIKQKQYDKEKKRYLLSERDVLAFWNRYFEPLMNLSKGDYTPIPEGYCVKPTAMDKAYKKLVEPLMDYLNSPEGTQKFADWERSLEMQRLGDKYGISESQSAWEMEQLSFYHSGHELQGVAAERYSIRDFSKLSETPTYRTFEKNGQTIKIPEKVCAIAGTVVGSDNTKHIVNLLTLTGVVNVKMYAEMYNKFKAKISVIDKETGEKKVLDDSWFKRGTKLLIYGYRREDTFVAKNVKVNGYQRSVVLINKKNDDGSLYLCFSRNTQ